MAATENTTIPPPPTAKALIAPFAARHPSVGQRAGRGCNTTAKGGGSRMVASALQRSHFFQHKRRSSQTCNPPP
jgi:hypothetical protein